MGDTPSDVVTNLAALGYKDLALNVLHALLDKGVISKEEFEKLRQEWRKLRIKKVVDKDAEGE